jgi:orotate phosphoribosyltransferase-like protein
MENKTKRMTDKDIHAIIMESISNVLKYRTRLKELGVKEKIFLYSCEGLDIDNVNKIISYNPTHENQVDTSVQDNLTYEIYRIGEMDIPVWSIFKRKRTPDGMPCRNDGNPLIYALNNNENGWRFKNENDRDSIFEQMGLISEKFTETHSYGVTIILPSGGSIHTFLANIMERLNPNSVILNSLLSQMTVEDVYDEVIETNSLFRKHYAANYEKALNLFSKYLGEMDNEKNGMFSFRYIKDNEMRNCIEKTFKIVDDGILSYSDEINGKDILIIDDKITNGGTVKSAIKVITEVFTPKTISVLTMFS